MRRPVLDPTISVVMATYKEPEAFVRESLDSLLIQDYTDFEIVIVLDNALHERLWRILSDYGKANSGKLSVFKNPSNLGLAYSLNRAVKLSRGRFIARMDSDDVCLAKRLRIQLKYLIEHPETTLVGSAAYLIDQKGERVGRIDVPAEHEDIAQVIERRMPMFHPTWLCRKEVFERVEYRHFPAAQDYDFLLRLIDEGYRLANIEEPLIKYRISMKGVSRSKLAIQSQCASLALKLHRQRETLGYESTELRPEAFNPGRIDELVASIWLGVTVRKETSKRKYVRKFCKMLLPVVAFFMPLSGTSIKLRLAKKLERRKRKKNAT